MTRNAILTLALLLALTSIISTAAATDTALNASNESEECFKVGYSKELWCTTKKTSIIKLPMQQGKNFCGQALMQAFIPEVSQYKLRKELNKDRFMRTYWSDFNTIFDRYEITYHWGRVSELNTPIIVGGYTQSHVILVLEKTNATHYTAFDPAQGLIYPIAERIEQWNGLVVDNV